MVTASIPEQHSVADHLPTMHNLVLILTLVDTLVLCMSLSRKRLDILFTTQSRPRWWGYDYPSCPWMSVAADFSNIISSSALQGAIQLEADGPPWTNQLASIMWLRKFRCSPMWISHPWRVYVVPRSCKWAPFHLVDSESTSQGL